VQGVYIVDSRRIERVISNAGTPNGMLVLPDRETLFSNDQRLEDGQRLSKAELEVPFLQGRGLFSL
jgi:sugar lactone lactonase YvrE